MSYPTGPTPPQPPQYYPAPPAQFAPQRSDPSTPLDQPYYGIGLIAGWKRYWTKYAVFSGRASRSEFWFAFLGNAIIGAVFYALVLIASLASGVFGDNGSTSTAGAVVTTVIGVAFGVFWLASIVPGLAMYWRRLHDVNLAGPWALLILVPSLGSIWSIVIGCLPTNPAGARFDQA